MPSQRDRDEKTKIQKEEEIKGVKTLENNSFYAHNIWDEKLWMLKHTQKK